MPPRGAQEKHHGPHHRHVRPLRRPGDDPGHVERHESAQAPVPGLRSQGQAPAPGDRHGDRAQSAVGQATSVGQGVSGMWCRRCGRPVVYDHVWLGHACACIRMSQEAQRDGMPLPPYWTHEPRTQPPAPALTQHVQRADLVAMMHAGWHETAEEQARRQQVQQARQRPVRPLAELLHTMGLLYPMPSQAMPAPPPPPRPKVTRPEPLGPRMIHLD